MMSRCLLASVMIQGLMATVAADAEEFDCLIEPYQSVAIRSPVDGLIESIHVRRGDSVSSGDLLVQLDSRSERATVEVARYRAAMEGRLTSARNRVDFANKKLARLEDLHQQSFISGQTRDEAETERLLAEAELLDEKENKRLAGLEYQRAEALLDLRSLRSPLDGVVVDRLANPGELAESGIGGNPILELAQVDPLLVKVALPSRLYGQVRPGMTGLVTPEVSTDALSAQVTIVDTVFDAASGTFGMRLELPNAGGKVPAGIRCSLALPELQLVGPE